MKKNIFVIGLDPVNRAFLMTSPLAKYYNFQPFFTFDEVKKGNGGYPVKKLFSRIDKKARNKNGMVDGVIGFWDFPVTSLLAISCAKLGLPGPSLQSLLKCEHKYWSRLVQKEVIPEAIPPFALVDPHDDSQIDQPPLPYPFWLKPIKSTSSYLSFKIQDKASFQKALSKIREEIHSIAEPFNFLLKQCRAPSQIASIKGHYCLAEGALHGQMCTVEGYVYQNEITIYGIIASVKDQNGFSFAYYLYPLQVSSLIAEKLRDYTHRVISHIGLNNTAFNIEYFYDEHTNDVKLLEINPRISQSHSYLFEKVDGLPNYSIIIDLALGVRPHFISGQGQYRCAAKFYMRWYEDGIVHKVPSSEDIQAVKSKCPDSEIELLVHENTRLSDMIEQDSYSYELAHIYLCGPTLQSIFEAYEICKQKLQFQIESVHEAHK